MSAYLGVSAQYHDAAAALVVDGRVVAALQEERLSRVKNDPSVPLAAARACLRIAGIAAADLDAIVFYEDPYARFEHVLTSVFRGFPKTARMFPKAMASHLSNKLWVLDQLAEGLAVPRARVGFTGHHRAHAASAFYGSDFPRAAVLVVDGVGEDTTTSIWVGDGASLVQRESIAFPHSLGLLYAALTAWLGFRVLEGEQKVMGLAAFGEARFLDEARSLVRCEGDGSFALDLRCFAHHTDDALGYTRVFEERLGPARAPGAPWSFTDDPAARRYADVAASVQLVVEDALIGLARRARAVSGAEDLCLAGGVALNACANARIAAEAGFARVFVQPAAGDAGGALGAALDAHAQRAGTRPAAPTTAALGVPIDAGCALDLARALNLPARVIDDPAQEAARVVLRGGVVAFAQGRSEWGPRALGQRSLLAPPAPIAVKDRLNAAIKRREPFRPFAPAVRDEDAERFFDGLHPTMTRCMTTVARSRDDARDALAAVTHVDGTARVQTVAHASSPELCRVLDQIAAAGAVPVVLNTSLNGRREPICARTVDVVSFFTGHGGVEALLCGDVLIERGGA